MSLGFGTSFWWVLVLKQWSNSKKSASIFSSSRWFLRMSRILFYVAIGIISISLMWPPFNNFVVSSRMTCRFSSLKFRLLWQTGRTLGSMVRWWHRKSGSMSGMSAADHAKASRCLVMTSKIWSRNSMLRDCPSLNIFPPIKNFGLPSSML